MAGVSIQVESAGLERLAKRLAAIADAAARSSLLESVAAEIESQTHRRIRSGGPAPDGAAWAPWSAAYARTRQAKSKLFSQGDLDDSIQALVTGEEAEVGTNLVYGAIHQFGGGEAGIAIPARPYLGLSASEAADIDAIVDDWLEGQIGEA